MSKKRVDLKMYDEIMDAHMFLPQLTENKTTDPDQNQPASNNGNLGSCEQNLPFTALNQLLPWVDIQPRLVQRHRYYFVVYSQRAFASW